MTPNRDPSLWWFGFEFPRPERLISIVRVQDYWVATTETAIYKLSTGHDGMGSVTKIQELYL